MGRLARDLVEVNGSDANFRAWAQFIHDGLIAAGMVQTSDTGQANLATITVPVAINTYPYYEVFRLGDSLHATKPVYLKVEYGASGATTRPSSRYTVGPGTDGAGGITAGWGAVMTPPATASSSAAQTCYCSGDGSSFVLSMWTTFTTASTSFQFFLERSRDHNGLPTGDGLAFGYGGNVRILAYAGVWSSANCAALSMLCPFPTVESTSSAVAKGNSPDGVTIPWIPASFVCPTVPAWRSAVMVGVHPYDAGLGSTFSISTHGGAAKTYLQPGLDCPSAGLGTYASAISTNYFMSQIWEP